MVDGHKKFEHIPLTEDEIDLIDKMLALDPKERLGSQNINDLKKHRYFNGINFEEVSSKDFNNCKIIIAELNDRLK